MEVVSSHGLAAQMAGEVSVTQEVAKRFLDAVPAALKKSLEMGKTIELGGTGRFRKADDQQQLHSVNGAEACRMISELAGIDIQTCGKLCQAFASIFQKLLLQRKVVRIEGLGDFQIQQTKAKIVKDSVRGHKLIKSPVRYVHLKTASELREALGKTDVVFEPEKDVRAVIEKSRTSSILLAVPERDAFIETLEYYFSRAGWHIETVTDALEALRKIKTNGVHLVIADSTLTDYQKLCYGLKCNKETSLIPLILMFPKTVDPEVPSELMICGDEHIVQPFEIKRLLETADSELIRASDERAVFQHQLVFRIPTVDSAIEKANELGNRLFEESGLYEEGKIALAAAFREAIGNAAQHGNRYQQNKKIEILYLQDMEKITISVTDCGNGFDHEFYVSRARMGDAVSAAKERYRQGRVGGLGIMLMLKCVDKLEYNKKGNRITLTKMLRPSIAHASNT